jgi:hypothetical protein
MLLMCTARQVRNGYANVVWTTTPRHAAELEAAAPEAFADAVNAVRRSRAATDLLTGVG